jgi:hypothetical protein
VADGGQGKGEKAEGWGEGKGTKWAKRNGRGLTLAESISHLTSTEWEAGDVVGLFLDCDKREMSFSIRGENIGVIFRVVFLFDEKSRLA